MSLETKDCSLELKNVDVKSGIVEGYFSAFGNIDSDGDMIMPGAFAKSISERGPDSSSNRKIAHLYSHDTWTPLAKIEELKEDKMGLRYRSKWSKAQKAQDVLIQMSEGIIREHSVGYLRIPAKEKVRDDYNEIQEVNLFEGSTLMFGANSNTPIASIKGLEKSKQMEIINDQITAIEKFLKNGPANHSDESYYLLEIEMNKLKANVAALVVKEPSNDTPPHIEPLQADGGLLASIYNNLN